MRDANIFFLYVVKFSELFILTVLTIYMTGQTSNIMSLSNDFKREYRLDDRVCKDQNCFENGPIRLFVLLFIAWLHLLHQRLLTNIRLALRE